jgi:Zn-dependent peptidase ImmA (M78 family)
MLIRRKLVKTKAKEILSAWGKSDLPVNVREIAKAQSIIVDEDKQPKESLSGFLFVDGDTKIIGVNKSHPKTRRRFTIAHELGHYFLHTHDHGSPHVDKQSNVSSTHFRDDSSSEGINAQEIEANLFAAELLMPEELIYEQLKALSSMPEYCGEEVIEKLSEKFDVSIQAMTLRLTNLELLKL